MYLNNHSCYSLKYGTLKPEHLLQLAMQQGVSALALTDINNTSACMDFIRLAEKYGIKPLVGIDFRTENKQLYVGIAKNNTGFFELNQFLSEYIHRHEELPKRPPVLENVHFIYPWAAYTGFILAENEWIGVNSRELNQLFLGSNAQLAAKMVVLQTVSFGSKADFNAHRLLRAIAQNCLLSKLPVAQQGLLQHQFIPPQVLRNSFKSFPQILDNTLHIISSSSISFAIGKAAVSQNLQTYTGCPQRDFELIKQLCKQGIAYRYNNQITAQLTERMEKELHLIKEKGFLSYFLINWDILNYARYKNYYYVGRGSGANSLVAYLLRITDVDPLALDLYFERFINMYRVNPPDFDIDFSWTDRDDVTKYIFNRFDHVALLATYNTFQYRAVIRELSKVFGLPKNEIDKLCSGKFQFDKLDELSRLVIRYGKYLEGLPSHLSIHAGGILIAEQAINHYTATFMPPKGYPTTQFDMVVAEDIGLYKFDILSQRGLGKIKDAVTIIKQNNPADPEIDIHDIEKFKEDNKVKNLLREAQAMGCFYVESPAMRMLLKKLQVDDYLTLVAASSIIRPGVAKSGMMREYILRHRFPERRKDAHPTMLQIMPDTYGVMVYQEDVIKVAHYFAGLSLGEADVLRRGMSGKFRSREEFELVKDKFFSNCTAKGYPLQLSAEVWRQIESFAGYAFAKGHSASYAVESYQSLYLKAYYPIEYMVAVINNFGGYYATEFYVHEARMWGANIEAPCINNSKWVSAVYGKDLFIGFMHLQGFEQKIGDLIISNRDRFGPFESFDDFIDRIPISLEQISILIKIDAFRFTHIPKRTLLWEAHFKLSYGKTSKIQQANLFKVQHKKHAIPLLHNSAIEAAFDQIDLLGFPLCSPFNLLEKKVISTFTSAHFKQNYGNEIEIYGYLVSIKTTKTSKGDLMYFGTFTDVEGHFFDTTHFPPVARAFPFCGKGIYLIKGRVEVEFDFYSVEVSELQKMKLLEDPRYFVPKVGELGMSNMV